MATCDRALLNNFSRPSTEDASKQNQNTIEWFKNLERQHVVSPRKGSFGEFPDPMDILLAPLQPLIVVGMEVGEWIQTDKWLMIDISLPGSPKASDVEVAISHNFLKVGRKGGAPFILDDLTAHVDPEDSYWRLTDYKILQILLRKFLSGPWKNIFTTSINLTTLPVHLTTSQLDQAMLHEWADGQRATYKDAESENGKGMHSHKRKPGMRDEEGVQHLLGLQSMPDREMDVLPVPERSHSLPDRDLHILLSFALPAIALAVTIMVATHFLLLPALRKQQKDASAKQKKKKALLGLALDKSVIGATDPPALADDTATIDVNEQSNDCVVCLDASRCVVAHPCGHLVCCIRCRRKLVHQALVLEGKCANSAAAKKALATKELERTRVGCPICRASIILILHQRFHGRVYDGAE